MDKLQDHIARLREDFMSGTLNETDVNRDPGVQFNKLKRFYEVVIGAGIEPECNVFGGAQCGKK